MRLSYHEIKQYTDRPECLSLAPGATARFNHSGCASTSSSRSLAVTRSDNGAWVLHCFKCGGSGATGGVYRPGLEQEPVGKREYKKPAWEYRLEEFPVPVKLWLNKCAVSQDALREARIRYDTINEVLQFTIWGPDETPKGRINRLFSKAEGPKYLCSGQRTWLRCTVSSTLVAVEDYLSGLQCYLAGYSSVSLGSTRMPSHVLSELLAGNTLTGKPFSRVVIFLDNDNPDVRKSARTLSNTLSLYFKVEVVREKRDPKELTLEELRGIL